MHGVRGGRGMAVGGGAGVVGVIVVLLITLLEGDIDPSAAVPRWRDRGGQQQQGEVIDECKTGEDAERSRDCRLIGTVNSIQAYWAGAVEGYTPSVTVFFTDHGDQVRAATADVGPFYCPADKKVYVDLGFFEDLQTKFGAEGGPFARAYVLAHEYGHHVQDLLGVLDQMGGDREGPSAAVRTELQADCYAGVWAANAVDTASSRRSVKTRSRRRWMPRRRSATIASSGRLRAGQPRSVDARLVSATPAVVHDRLPGRRPERLRHVQRHRLTRRRINQGELRSRPGPVVDRSGAVTEEAARAVPLDRDDLRDDGLRDLLRAFAAEVEAGGPWIRCRAASPASTPSSRSSINRRSVLAPGPSVPM